jgi:hypothetical protein
MSCADEKNPLQHSGTSQQQRKAAALQPAFVRADEHDFPEWIVFASRFSQYLNYYSEANIPTNNWQPFFDNDIAAVLGSLAIQNIDDYRRQIKERFDFLRDDDNEDEPDKLEATLGGLFSAMLTLSLGLDTYLFRLPEAHPLQLSLRNLITQKLQPALRMLLSYYKGGRSKLRNDGTEDASLIIIANKDFPDWRILGRPVMDVKETIATQNLSALWLEGKPTLKSFFNSLSTDDSIYGDEADAPFRRIQHAANHNLFTALFDQFLSSYAQLIRDAETSLVEALTQFNAHPPHYALFLSFLHLFRRAQDQLNTLTQRHLDFYYTRVLRLAPRTALPNRVHLLAELAKGFTDFSLPKGTLFRAGKDSLGKEVFYALDEETVFNQAKVAKLMSVYRGAAVGLNGQPPIDDIGTVNNEGRVFASPVANSADGLGAEFKTEDKAWQPFVQKTFVDGALQSINAPKAALGFAIASSYLALVEGDRDIQLTLLLGPLSAPLPADLRFVAWLTTPKKWLQVPATVQTSSASSGGSDAITISISLDGSAPAISNWDPKVHGESLGATLPTLKIYLTNDDSEAYQYDALRNCTLQSVSLNVSVGVDAGTGKATQTGIRQLQLANEFGTIDPAKPFQPFGLSPRPGSAFLVGSEEFFKKPGAAFQLKLKWLDLPASSSAMDYDGDNPEDDKTPNVSLDVLAKGSWREVLSDEDLWREIQRKGRGGTGTRKFLSNIIDSENEFPAGSTSLLLGTGGADASAYLAYDDVYGPYSVSSRAGFLRIVLKDGFGYEDYQKAYAEYLAKLAFGSGTNPGAAPYVPKLESISLHYTAETTEVVNAGSEADFEDRSIRFYHLTPFGSAELHHVLTPDADTMLLPQVAPDEAGRDSGELYIGLTNLKAFQAVNLLFGIVEGSGDPLTVKPEQHLSWSYLSNNGWKDFAPQLVRDGTLQWIQTGIISLSIPEDATTDNTLLPAGYLWLKASVKSATLAVCKLLSVDAQAATATFSNNGNASDFLNAPLPAGTISKLRTAAPAIRKIMQPYASFGGRPAEQSANFYIRVSERLRHKDRAITIWDYERLILEAFPALHRVKCLSHTAYEQLPDGTKRYNEMAPGHVTIITIPALQDLQLANPLRPYTSERVLAQIEAFVHERISCQVQPHVVHPLFEEVALDFQLRLMPGFDDYTFYIQTLQEEITRFLTPWAYSPEADIAFGGTVRKSVLINFIEERPYVDYISQVRMYHRTAEDPNSVADTDEAVASTGMAILVSVPPTKHKITPIPLLPAGAIAVLCIDPANTAAAPMQLDR